MAELSDFQYSQYSIDLVLCIDGSAHMAQIIDKVKQQAKSFPDLYVTGMQRYMFKTGPVRAKVIVFRDYAIDGENAMIESPDFFDLNDPEEKKVFERYVDDIEPRGGGENGSNALEAIALALQSKWTIGRRFRRHAILLFTNTPALPLGENSRVSVENYPKGIPSSLDGLQTLFRYGDKQLAPYYTPSRGHLIIFAPASADSTWGAFRSWPTRTWVVPTFENGGGEYIELEDALSALFGS